MRDSKIVIEHNLKGWRYLYCYGNWHLLLAILIMICPTHIYPLAKQRMLYNPLNTTFWSSQNTIFRGAVVCIH